MSNLDLVLIRNSKVAEKNKTLFLNTFFDGIAPKEMGFKVILGENMHTYSEPETKEEAKRIFEELSADGNITMPLQDMFWGAYFSFSKIDMASIVEL